MALERRSVVAQSSGDGDGPMPAGKRACVVHTLCEPGQRERIVWVDGVDNALVDELGQILVDYETDPNRVEFVRIFCVAHGLGGITIVQEYGATSGFPIPAGIDYSFEPVRLNQRDERLRQLVSSAVEHAGHARETPRVRNWSWMSISNVLLVSGTLLLAIATPIKLMRTGWRLDDLVFGGVMLLVCLSTLVSTGSISLSKWWVAPSAIIILNSWRVAARSRLLVVIPDDAILLVSHTSSGWETRIYSTQSTLIARIVLNDREWLMLFAAWRSPLPPPTMEQIEQAL